MRKIFMLAITAAALGFSVPSLAHETGNGSGSGYGPGYGPGMMGAMAVVMAPAP